MRFYVPEQHKSQFSSRKMFLKTQNALGKKSHWVEGIIRKWQHVARIRISIIVTGSFLQPLRLSVFVFT